MKEIPKPQEQKDPNLIEEISYQEDESAEFDDYLKGKEKTNARQDDLSERTKEKILTSGWHVPCHCIIVKTKEGVCQAFHVQPNKLSASFLTFTQEQALKRLGEEGAEAIGAKGGRSYFGLPDIQELQRMGIKYLRTVDVDTSNWWRLFFDPKTNEIWIDVKDKHKLKKYKGF